MQPNDSDSVLLTENAERHRLNLFHKGNTLNVYSTTL